MSRPRGGVWIETWEAHPYHAHIDRHAPAGACGLKLAELVPLVRRVRSRPRGGVWIETLMLKK